MKPAIIAAATLTALCSLAACARQDAVPANADTPAPVASTPAAAADVAPATSEPAAERPLQASELDAYARGLQAEIARLGQSADKVRQARAANDDAAETSALMEMTSGDVDAAGARAAGLDPARYDFVKHAVEGVLGKLEMLQGLANTDGGDPAEMTPEDRKRMADNLASLQAQIGDPYAGLAPEVAAALKARQAELAQLRAQSIGARTSVL